MAGRAPRAAATPQEFARNLRRRLEEAEKRGGEVHLDPLEVQVVMTILRRWSGEQR